MTAAPDRVCDLVMKGGVTSGIVYPLAIHRLSRRFRFKNIGGSSAGAIAAACAAAAEFRRSRGGPGDDAGFAALQALPKELASGGWLLDLFTPERATRPIFELLLVALGDYRLPLKIFLVLARAMASLWGASLVGLAPAAIVYALELEGACSWGWGTASLVAALMTLVAVPFALSVSLGWRLVRCVPANGYGLCRGFDSTPAKNGRVSPRLTSWLTFKINEFAGLSQDRPLTFGDLWRATNPLLRSAGTASDEDLAKDPTKRGINMVVLTTCLSHGAPYQIPFEKRIFYFDPDELGRYFPASVVSAMVRNARPLDEGEELPRAPGVERLHPLPLPAQLPVIVAVRMSLSFPLLLSAVPLYAVDYSRKQEKGNLRAEKVWFSDGGICSNFPVHFFDELVPAWPTFGISLKGFHPDHEPQPGRSATREQAVWLPATNRQGILERWTHIASDGRQGLGGFFAAILDTMQQWADNAQCRLPGYRDRIVYVCHGSKEGGLNLAMPAKTMDGLMERGEWAGDALIERFVEGDGWPNHQSIRLRAGMASLETLMRRLGPRLAQETAVTSTWPDGDRREAIRQLASFTEEWSRSERFHRSDIPHPEALLCLRPRV